MENDEEKQDQAAAFVRIWSDSCSKILQLAMTYTPETAPPEFLKQIRVAVLQAMTQTWDSFLRSPQFLEVTKKYTEQALEFRRLSAEFFTKARHGTEGVAHEDVEALRATLGQMETHMARQFESLGKQINQLAAGLGDSRKDRARAGSRPRATALDSRRRAASRPSRRDTGAGKT